MKARMFNGKVLYYLLKHYSYIQIIIIFIVLDSGFFDSEI
jgi:hypothetical protein